MKKTALLVVILAVTVACLAQQQGKLEGEQKTDPPPAASRQDGQVLLSAPYIISTAPHFAVLVQFPKEDSIRRIALGDSSYFLAEADKDDPHYAIVKQIRMSSVKDKTPIVTNMLVYMASGRVIDVTLRSGTLAETAYVIDYPLPKSGPTQITPPPLAQSVEKPTEEQQHKELENRLLEEAKSAAKSDATSAGGGLAMHLYRTERQDELAFISFDVENDSPNVVDLEGPQVNLVTLSDKPKRRKKAAPANVEPVQLVESSVSSKQLTPGARSICLVEFKPPVHDSNQHVVLSVANRAMADQPATVQIE